MVEASSVPFKQNPLEAPPQIIPSAWADPHVWAKILVDATSIIGIATKILPPKYGAVLIGISTTLFAVDQIVTGAIQNVGANQAAAASVAPPASPAPATTTVVGISTP